MANKGLTSAKKAKNDEFYTQFHDIEKEMNAYLEYNPEVFKDKTVLLPCDDPEWSNFTRYFAQNFEKLQLKKLISTSYAPNSKPGEVSYQPTLFEIESPEFDASKTQSNGKIFTLTKDKSGDGVINFDDLEWSYLEGGGDFRSEEVTRLRDEADFIITNPPFSLFREFWRWVLESENKFMVLGNLNSISLQEVFERIKANKAWLGTGMGRWISGFIVPEGYELYGTEARLVEGQRIISTNNSIWLTNIDHGKRHEPIPLMTENDNLKFSRHYKVSSEGYKEYDNFMAVEVPFTDSIPSDFEGAMGVPISFLGRYSPEQFEILGMTGNRTTPESLKKPELPKYDRPYLNGKRMYARIFIQHKGEKHGN